MFLPNILIDSCMILEEKIFLVNFYTLSLQKKFYHIFSKYHIKDCFKINGKKTIKMPQEDEYVKFKNFERKIKSLFMIYAGFESILVREDKVMQNPNESYIS